MLDEQNVVAYIRAKISRFDLIICIVTISLALIFFIFWITLLCVNLDGFKILSNTGAVSGSEHLKKLDTKETLCYCFFIIFICAWIIDIGAFIAISIRRWRHLGKLWKAWKRVDISEMQKFKPKKAFWNLFYCSKNINNLLLLTQKNLNHHEDLEVIPTCKDV